MSVSKQIDNVSDRSIQGILYTDISDQCFILTTVSLNSRNQLYALRN